MATGEGQQQAVDGVSRRRPAAGRIASRGRAGHAGRSVRLSAPVPRRQQQLAPQPRLGVFVDTAPQCGGPSGTHAACAGQRLLTGNTARLTELTTTRSCCNQCRALPPEVQPAVGLDLVQPTATGSSGARQIASCAGNPNSG